MDERGLTRHRLNACGYSLGARFTPSWMEHQMFHTGNPLEIAPDMTLFVHMIIMDSETNTAMTLGQTYLTTEDEPESLSAKPLDLIAVPIRPASAILKPAVCRLNTPPSCPVSKIDRPAPGIS
jgi:Xaa-Pro dipeptidase